ncbi:MAG: hypothetical protein ACKOU7_02750 [Ferruginibacter sp.]
MKIKSRSAAFILSVIYLLSSAAAPEFFKLPVLAGHYYNHREENRSLNLVSFLIQHYYYEHGRDKDAEEDNKLPFKSAENTSTASFVSLVPPPLTATIHATHLEIKRALGIYPDPHLPSQYLKSIWQPPRLHIPYSA